MWWFISIVIFCVWFISNIVGNNNSTSSVSIPKYEFKDELSKEIYTNAKSGLISYINNYFKPNDIHIRDYRIVIHIKTDELTVINDDVSRAGFSYDFISSHNVTLTDSTLVVLHHKLSEDMYRLSKVNVKGSGRCEDGDGFKIGIEMINPYYVETRSI